VAGEASELVLGGTDPVRAAEAARAAGVEAAQVHDDAIRVRPGVVSAEAVVAAVVAAGVGVSSVGRGRHLEEAFLELIGATEPSS
jgi:hypothetical protein